MAIAGIIMFILALFYPEYRSSDITKEIVLYNGEIKKLSVENEKAKSKLKEIKDEIDILDVKSNNKGSVVNDTIISRTRILSGQSDLVELSKKIDKLVIEWTQINRQIELKSIDINVKSDLIENKQKDLEKLNSVMNFLGPISMFLTFLGFVFWYEKTQKLQDKVLSEQTNRFLDDERCQSCGMLLITQHNFNLFTDDDKKSIYCKTCYLDGEFTEPNLTLEKMKKKMKIRCKELKFGKLSSFVLINRLGALQRWKNKFTW